MAGFYQQQATFDAFLNSRQIPSRREEREWGGARQVFFLIKPKFGAPSGPLLQPTR